MFLEQIDTLHWRAHSIDSSNLRPCLSSKPANLFLIPLCLKNFGSILYIHHPLSTYLFIYLWSLYLTQTAFLTTPILGAGECFYNKSIQFTGVYRFSRFYVFDIRPYHSPMSAIFVLISLCPKTSDSILFKYSPSSFNLILLSPYDLTI